MYNKPLTMLHKSWKMNDENSITVMLELIFCTLNRRCQQVACYKTLTLNGSIDKVQAAKID